LIADGRTNREVAEQLVLSPRTIEAHLRDISASSACARAWSSRASSKGSRPAR